MTENEKTNTKSIKNAPLFDTGVSIFGKKTNQTNHPKEPQTNEMKYSMYACRC